MNGFGTGSSAEYVGRMSTLGAALTLVLLSGCASPGPPQPPSLKLPEIVTGLTASRVGNEVRLQWTTPSRTTDKMLITEPIVAEICRETPSSVPSASIQAGQNSAPSERKNALTAPCSPVVLRVQVKPGASVAVEPLPAELTLAPARLLAYRVQLRNVAGRTAGASVVAFAASGPAPQAVEEMSGRTTKAGIVLEWRPEAQGTEGGDTIELDRNIVQPATANTTATSAGLTRKIDLPDATKEPLETRFRTGAAGSSNADAGGTVDRTAQIGHTYRYTAQRVRSVEEGGQTLHVRGLPSAVVIVEMKDVFPPEVPVGLVAVPGFASATNDSTQKPTIDLSWEPDMEPRVAGYRVYRRDLDGDATKAWQQLTSVLLPSAAYRDLSVVAGGRYAYRVTAVDAAGNESAPSDQVVETAPAS
jgi:hypothetical protein